MNARLAWSDTIETSSMPHGNSGVETDLHFLVLHL